MYDVSQTSKYVNYGRSKLLQINTYHKFNLCKENKFIQKEGVGSMIKSFIQRAFIVILMLLVVFVNFGMSVRNVDAIETENYKSKYGLTYPERLRAIGFSFTV